VLLGSRELFRIAFGDGCQASDILITDASQKFVSRYSPWKT
jgi:hypothetical protein